MGREMKGQGQRSAFETYRMSGQQMAEQAWVSVGSLVGRQEMMFWRRKGRCWTIGDQEKAEKAMSMGAQGRRLKAWRWVERRASEGREGSTVGLSMMDANSLSQLGPATSSFLLALSKLSEPPTSCYEVLSSAACRLVLNS